MSLTIEQAEKMRLCTTCNYAGVRKYEQKPCNYHTWPSLNYRNTPAGQCALYDDEVQRRKKEFGTDGVGRLAVKVVKRK